MKNDDWLLSCFHLLKGTWPTHVLSLKYIQAKAFSGCRLIATNQHDRNTFD